jgi:hypothetical protein
MLSMSQMGQSRRLASPLTTFGLPPTADITHRDHHFRKVPTPDSWTAEECRYFDHPVDIGELLGQPRFAKTLNHQLRTF